MLPKIPESAPLAPPDPSPHSWSALLPRAPYAPWRVWLSLILAGVLCAADQSRAVRSFGQQSAAATLLPLLYSGVPSDLGLNRLTLVYDHLLVKQKKADAQLLRTIAQKSGLGSDGTISLCTGPLYCVDFNGDLQPAAAASLIKVPIALVLVSRLEATNTSLNTAIYLDPGNYTEDHSAIAIGRPQTLRYLMTEMLANSSNTATNQLIDYLGMDTINRELKAMGFTRTSVTYKVVGDQIFPQNPGTVANRITSNELNRMMQLIYTHNTTGYHAIRAALAKQYDDTMGISALAGFNILEGRTVRWLGEKTGGTSRVLGTTLAFKLGEQICYLSVTTNNPGGESQIRKAIDAVVRSR